MVVRIARLDQNLHWERQVMGVQRSVLTEYGGAHNVLTSPLSGHQLSIELCNLLPSHVNSSAKLKLQFDIYNLHFVTSDLQFTIHNLQFALSRTWLTSKMSIYIQYITSVPKYTGYHFQFTIYTLSPLCVNASSLAPSFVSREDPARGFTNTSESPQYSEYPFVSSNL